MAEKTLKHTLRSDGVRKCGHRSVVAAFGRSVQLMPYFHGSPNKLILMSKERYIYGFLRGYLFFVIVVLML